MQTDQSFSMNSLWDIFKSSIYKSCESLPPAPKSSDPDWVTDEVRNLSKKKQKAWVSLKKAPLQDNSCQSEYNSLKTLARDAAENARNSWWSARDAEAKCRAQIAEQQGQGGSLIKDLHFCRRSSLNQLCPPWLLKMVPFCRVIGIS